MPEPTDREVILESRLAEAEARIAQLTHHDPVYRAAVRHFGEGLVMQDGVMHVSVLRAGLRLWASGSISDTDLAGAVADVEACCAMLRVIVGDSAVDAAKVQKLDRLVRRMGGGE